MSRRLSLRHDPQFQNQCTEAYRRLGSLDLVADEFGCSKETVRQALINAGVERIKKRPRMWESNAIRLDAHYSRIRKLKKTPKCIYCGLRLDLDAWGSEWPPINEDQQLCGWCNLEMP